MYAVLFACRHMSWNDICAATVVSVHTHVRCAVSSFVCHIIWPATWQPTLPTDTTSAMSVTGSSRTFSRSSDTWRPILILPQTSASTFCHHRCHRTGSCHATRSAVSSAKTKTKDRRCSCRQRRCGVVQFAVSAAARDRPWSATCCSTTVTLMHTSVFSVENAFWPHTSSTVTSVAMTVRCRCRSATLHIRRRRLHHVFARHVHALNVEWNSQQFAWWANTWPTVIRVSLTSRTLALSARNASPIRTRWSDTVSSMWTVPTCSRVARAANVSPRLTTATGMPVRTAPSGRSAASCVTSVSPRHTTWPTTWSHTPGTRCTFAAFVRNDSGSRLLWNVTWTCIVEPLRALTRPNFLSLRHLSCKCISVLASIFNFGTVHNKILIFSVLWIFQFVKNYLFPIFADICSNDLPSLSIVSIIVSLCTKIFNTL